MNLKGKHIFFTGTTKFDGLDQSTSYNIAKLLARDNFVYYIDYPFTWKDYIKLKGSAQFKTRKPLFASSSDGLLETEIPNFKIIILPPVLSINFVPEGIIYRTLLRLNEKIIAKRIKKVIRKFNISDFIYINSFNFHYPGVAHFVHPTLTVYHCVDPLIMPYDIKHGIISEQQLVKESDLVICTSRQLYNEKKTGNQNTFFIPNAADISHSSKALSQELPVNEYISKLKKPVIGYIGTVERRMDYDLLKQLINENKDKDFVFAGLVVHDFVPDWFVPMDNLHILGQLPYQEIPNVIKGFDVAIIPFKKDNVSGTIFPLKLFEYLGAGKPVVSTNFNPDLEEFTEGTVLFCEDFSSFSKSINDILQNDTPDNQQARIAVANKNTWENRASQILELIDVNLLEKKGNTITN